MVRGDPTLAVGGIVEVVSEEGRELLGSGVGSQKFVLGIGAGMKDLEFLVTKGETRCSSFVSGM